MRIKKTFYFERTLINAENICYKLFTFVINYSIPLKINSTQLYNLGTEVGLLHLKKFEYEGRMTIREQTGDQDLSLLYYEE